MHILRIWRVVFVRFWLSPYFICLHTNSILYTVCPHVYDLSPHNIHVPISTIILEVEYIFKVVILYFSQKISSINLHLFTRCVIILHFRASKFGATVAPVYFFLCHSCYIYRLYIIIDCAFEIISTDRTFDYFLWRSPKVNTWVRSHTQKRCST